MWCYKVRDYLPPRKLEMFCQLSEGGNKKYRSQVYELCNPIGV